MSLEVKRKGCRRGIILPVIYNSSYSMSQRILAPGGWPNEYSASSVKLQARIIPLNILFHSDIEGEKF